MVEYEYRVDEGRLVHVDMSKRTITVEDRWGYKWTYRLSEDIELSEDWIINHLDKTVKIFYKYEAGKYRTGPCIVLKIEEI